MKLYKMTFISMLIGGTLITISSNSWLGMWMGLEINLLSLIPLMSDSKNPRTSECSIKYFITQSLASLILLTSIMMINAQSWMNSNLMMINTPDMLMSSSLFLKTGAAPFHFWFPEVMEGATWSIALSLLTWQKVAPMVILMKNNLIHLMTIAIIFSAIIGSTLGLNQTSLRKIMAYSSINHISWMLAIMIFSEKIWSMYFIIYSISNSMLVWLFNNFKTTHVSQIQTITNSSPSLKSFFMMNLFSLGGTPPFIGFLPKWMVIQYLILSKMYLMSIILIITTLLTLYYYLRLALTLIIFSAPVFNTKPMNPEFKKKGFVMINSFLLISLMIYTATFNLA